MRIHDRGGGISAEINDACLFVTIGNFAGNVCRFILLFFTIHYQNYRLFNVIYH